MKKKKYTAPVFAYLYYQLLIVLLVLLLQQEKGKTELWINSYHSISADFIFKNITYLGDGIIIAVPILILLFVRYSYSILLAWATVIHMLVVVSCKQIFFKGIPRPAEYLMDSSFYTVPGVSVHHWNSFPSGHTASVFMLACVLAMINSKKMLPQIILFIIAILVGFSRVYLMQHFVMDVLAGSLVGVWSAFTSRWITLHFFSSKKFKKSLYPKRRVILQNLGKTVVIQN